MSEKCDACYTCLDNSNDPFNPFNPFNPVKSRMVLCPTCGNKRCPKATYHGNFCTHSNEPGQPGSNCRRVR